MTDLCANATHVHGVIEVSDGEVIGGEECSRLPVLVSVVNQIDF